MKATILEIQRMSTDDGPGLRTTVFFKGCGLRCIWCHNPESISPQPQIQWVDSRCIGCARCADTCRTGALSAEDGRVDIDREICAGCGDCARECPSTALEQLGREWELEELVYEVLKDREYFEKSGGGVTLSGGDPAMQPRFATAFLRRLKVAGINTALDTSGQCAPELLESMLLHTDVLLYDLKEADPECHHTYTSRPNDRILQNLRHVCLLMEERDRPGELWIRTPVIPGTTADHGNVRQLGELLTTLPPGVITRWELCAFNNLCKDKYIRLGHEWVFGDCELLTGEDMEDLAEVARTSGVDPGIVFWTGTTREGTG